MHMSPFEADRPSDMTNEALARNGVSGIPVIIERPDDFPFSEGEKERDWHVASDDEYAAYVTYWNARYDEDA